ILYELLSGQNPFGSDSPKLATAEVLAILLESRRRGPEPLCRSNAQVDKSLAQIVESCLAYNPNDRPKSAAELAARLRKHQSRLPRLRRWACRNARKLACVAALVLVVAGAGAYGISQREPAGLRWLRQGQESYQ